jgi:hypothetical protein
LAIRQKSGQTAFVSREKTPPETRQALEQLEGSAHDALSQNEATDYEQQTFKLSL